MSAPSQPTDTGNTTTTINAYKYIASYDFASDLEFRKGLGTILGHPGTPASDTELLSEENVILQAKCFYVSRKQNISPSIDYTAYKTWLAQHPNNTNNNIEESSVKQAPTEDDSSGGNDVKEDPGNEKETIASSSAEPAYPSSFAHIVDLITNNQPIPGIEEIPDTVLAGHDEPSKASRRRKPWEKETVVEDKS